MLWEKRIPPPSPPPPPALPFTRFYAHQTGTALNERHKTHETPTRQDKERKSITDGATKRMRKKKQEARALQ